MPIYEYECKSCKTRFEKLQPMTSEPIKICPECGEEQVRRVLQPVGVIFKGSGWYLTDSRKPAPSESSGESTPAAGASTSTDAAAKPSETKSESSSTPAPAKES